MRAEKSAAGGERWILVVDTDISVRELVRAVLGRSGFHVLTAGSGTQALETLVSLRRPVDLVITDLELPDISGAELARKLTKLLPAPVVLFMGADASTEQARLAPASHLVPKPFRPDELMDRVLMRLRLRSTPQVQLPRNHETA